MAVANINPPRDLGHALEMLGTKISVPLGHNTRLARDLSGAIVTYHGNIIAWFHEDGLTVTLAGWDTMTTRGRLHQFAGVSCGRIKGVTHINGQPVLPNQLVSIPQN